VSKVGSAMPNVYRVQIMFACLALTALRVTYASHVCNEASRHRKIGALISYAIHHCLYNNRNHDKKADQAIL
jgi:hypothetical protein